MFDSAVQHARVAREYDREGGSVERMGTATVLWCDPVLHDGEQRLVVQADEDIRIGDLVKIPLNLYLGG